jgi:hypothetical protein
MACRFIGVESSTEDASCIPMPVVLHTLLLCWGCVLLLASWWAVQSAA